MRRFFRLPAQRLVAASVFTHVLLAGLFLTLPAVTGAGPNDEGFRPVPAAIPNTVSTGLTRQLLDQPSHLTPERVHGGIQ
jgi:hypothetical protein